MRGRWRLTPFTLALAAAALAGCLPAVDPPDASPDGSVESGRTFYIAPDGSDDASGTLDDPWLTALRASGELRSGDVLLARGGRYVGQGGEGWASSGEADAPIVFEAYPGETPIFDGDGVESFLILRDVSHLTIRGLTVTGYEPLQNGVLVVVGASSGVTLEGMTMAGSTRDAPLGRWTEHLIYPGAGPVRDLTIRDNFLDMAGLQGGAIHVYHDPGPVNLLIEGNTISNAHWGVLIASDAHGVTVRNNVMMGNEFDVEVIDDRATDVEID